jgi:hypothetical protein
MQEVVHNDGSLTENAGCCLCCWQIANVTYAKDVFELVVL